MRLSTLLCCGALLAACGSGLSKDAALADAVSTLENAGVQCEDQPPAPPSAAAIAACTGMAANDACSFTAGTQTIAGTCRDIAGQLACAPAPATPPPPPPISACVGKEAGDPCAFGDDEDEQEPDDDDDVVNGTCVSVGGRPILLCISNRQLPAPIAVCLDKDAAAACSFTAGGVSVSGNCAAVAGQALLACVPPPPKALVDACVDKKAGDACSAAIGSATISSSCAVAADGTTLACLAPARRLDHPDHDGDQGDQGGNSGPGGPKVAACTGKAAGDTCSVEHGNESRAGVCRQQDNGRLACRPPNPPQLAIDACTDKAVGDACSFAWKEHTVNGTCRTAPDGTTVVCAPLCPSHD